MGDVPTPNIWIDRQDCSLPEFRSLVERETTENMVPLSDQIVSRIPVYDGGKVRFAAESAEAARAYMAEWNRVLCDGPGIIAIRDAHHDMEALDQTSEILLEIAAREEQSLAGAGDHFAAAGANTRIWNAHEKLCLASPEIFARYNAIAAVALASRAWLGPRYQITTQVNIIRPGGKAQTCHRDYHMGFMTHEDLVNYPLSVHTMSASLTLQGAIAHSAMPIESGPTKLLPFSQTYPKGYVAALLPEFHDYFEGNCVQLSLNKGDAVFFSPATFHAAGENRTSDIHRFANLMQIGSCFGRSIEIVNRTRMSVALYPALLRLKESGELNASAVEFVVEACAEGYPFPVNLDLDSPLSGMAPPSQRDLMLSALAERWPASRFEKEASEQADRRRAF